LVDEDRDAARAGPLAAGKRPMALSLLVMSPAGTTTVPVPASGRLLLGRADDCDVQIDDPKLSRHHAELRSGDLLEIVDLGSMNGSFLRDQRLAPHAPAVLGVGDAVSIGSTVLVLQRSLHVAERPFRLWTHGEFAARLDEECARADRGETTFGVARLRLVHNGAGAETQRGASPSTIFAAWLREAEMVAKYGPNDYEILLVDTSAADVDARSVDLAARLTAVGTGFELGAAACPRDGKTPDALLAQAARPLGARGARPPVRTVSQAMPVVGTLERMDRVVRRVAAGVINVLILGETGVGKELLARRIHELSPRAGRPLVSLNCAALAESLLESELFGHEKGAFTGASAPKIGLIESADGGSLFLDEVGEMPAPTQAKLLRVIEQREVTRVGAIRPRLIDVRFISATNRDLEREVAEGRFRQDLFFRLNGISLSVPPLRERAEEIDLLARTFIEQASRVMGREPPRLTPEALALLQRYRWPGNVRELRNVIERAVLLGSGPLITSEHLPAEKMESSPPPAPEGLAPAPPPGGAAGAPAPGGAERERILDALERCVWNQSQAAKLLGISRGTLIKRIEEYGLPRPRKRD